LAAGTHLGGRVSCRTELPTLGPWVPGRIDRRRRASPPTRKLQPITGRPRRYHVGTLVSSLWAFHLVETFWPSSSSATVPLDQQQRVTLWSGAHRRAPGPGSPWIIYVSRRGLPTGCRSDVRRAPRPLTTRAGERASPCHRLDGAAMDDDWWQVPLPRLRVPDELGFRRTRRVKPPEQWLVVGGPEWPDMERSAFPTARSR